jgi:hypothetical protein
VKSLVAVTPPFFPFNPRSCRESLRKQDPIVFSNAAFFRPLGFQRTASIRLFGSPLRRDSDSPKIARRLRLWPVPYRFNIYYLSPTLPYAPLFFTALLDFLAIPQQTRLHEHNPL